MSTLPPGLPEPREFERVPGPGPKVTHRVDFGPPLGRCVVQHLLWDPGYDPFARHTAAEALVGDRLPIPPISLVGPDRSIARFPLASGTSAQEVFAEDRRVGHGISRLIGGVAGTLFDRPVVGGAQADADGVFRPQNDWPGLWAEAAEWEVRTARAHGVDTAALRELHRRVQEGLDRLEAVQRFAVVHRDLRPANLMVERCGERLELRGVLDWGAALCGDPLLEWVWVAFAPPPWREGMLDGFGRSRTRALFTPGALERLDLYLQTRALGAIRRAAQLGTHGTAARAKRARTEADRLVAEVGEEGVAERRLGPWLG